MNSRYESENRALYWAMRNMSGELTSDERVAFSEWLRENPTHTGLYKQVINDAEEFDEAAFEIVNQDYVHELFLLSQKEKLKQEAKAAGALQTFITTMSSLWAGVRHRSAGLGRYPVAAAVSTAFGIFLAAILFAPAPVTPSVEYATAIGEQRRVMLSDGSALQLNTATRLEVALDNETRLVTLASGEAAFDVAHMPDREFVVRAGLADIRVTGTAFTVRKNETATTVFVTEGSVFVSPKSGEGLSAQRGDIIYLGDTATKSQLTDADLKNAMSWTEGIVRFQNAPLRNVIAELNRYYARPIAIDDPDLGSLFVTGTFSIKDQAETVDALAIAFELNTQHLPDRVILKRPPLE